MSAICLAHNFCLTECEPPISRYRPKSIDSHGLRVLKASHHSIRELKRHYTPSYFGYRVWETSWLLIDFMKQESFPEGLNIMEVGCGWGLPSIYCAKNHQAQVTCLDRDSNVFPFLQLHAEVNDVQVACMNMGFEDLTPEHFTGIDVLLGVEICFWNTLVSRLMHMIRMASQAGVRLILIADPGRPPFEALEAQCLDQYHRSALTWRIFRPYHHQGRILKLGSLGPTR